MPTSFNPWPWFAAFVYINLYFSFGDIRLENNLWLGLGVVLFPLLGIFYLSMFKKNKASDFNQDDPSSIPPRWLWVIFFILLLFTRFYRLDSFPDWPVTDEGGTAYTAIELFNKWSHKLLFTEGQNEPLFFWGLALFFKVFEPSIFSIRLYSALISLATVGAGYWAARQYFSKQIVFYTTWLLALSFWPFTLDKLCMWVDSLPLMECLALGCLGLFLNSSDLQSKWKKIIFLGFMTGVGFYSFTSWPLMALMISAAVFHKYFLKNPRQPMIFFLFGTISFILVIPLLITRLSPNGLAHVYGEFRPDQFFNSGLKYLSTLFWNGFKNAPYGPDWGGLFNPIFGGLVFLGAMELFRFRNARWVWWLTAAFFVFLLSGALTIAIENHHIALELVVLVVPATFGLQSLFRKTAAQWQWIIILMVLLTSFALDVYHFTVPYLDPKVLAKNNVHWRSSMAQEAYEIVKAESSLKGPLFILSQFTTNYEEQTFKVAVFPFDAIQNPKFKGTTVKEIACFTDSYYAPFLRERFPLAKLLILIQKDDPTQPKRLLAFIPIDDQSRPVLEKWVKAEKIFDETTSEWLQRTGSDSEERVRDILIRSYPEISGDPFLESIYWSKMDLSYWINQNIPKRLECQEQNLKKGYPTAVLYCDLGVALLNLKRLDESRAAFMKAVQAPMDDTKASTYLKGFRD